jgi:hypothetical protein
MATNGPSRAARAAADDARTAPEILIAAPGALSHQLAAALGSDYTVSVATDDRQLAQGACALHPDLILVDAPVTLLRDDDQRTATRIFEPFFTTMKRGIGMGLAISRALVEAHGGAPWVDVDEAPGAAFHFTLPVAE